MSLIWPFPTRDDGPNPGADGSGQWRRIDQGQDLQVPVGTPLLAPADGVIHYGHDPAGFGDPYPVIALAEPVDGNPGLYLGHNHPEVPEGASVSRGQVVAHTLQVPGGNARGDPGWLEIGWWNNGPTGNGQSIHDHLMAAPVYAAAAPETVGVMAGTSGFASIRSDGGVYNFDESRFAGSLAGRPLAAPIVGGAYTRSGGGYWLVAADGGLFGFGDARFYGSLGGLRLNRPIVGMTATPDGGGYWMVASDGGIFAFGDARFYGSTGAVRLNQPIVGMAETPSGRGYWLTAADGGVFCFGDAPFRGAYSSLSGQKTGRRIVGLAPLGDGYVQVSQWNEPYRWV